MSEEYLSDILLLRRQLYWDDEEEIINIYDDPKDFQNILNIFNSVLEFDKLLFFDGTLDKFLNLITKYQLTHKDPNVTKVCNEFKVQINSEFSKIPKEDYNDYLENYHRENLVKRGILNKSLKIPKEVMKIFIDSDFFTFIILNSCVALQFSDISKPSSELTIDDLKNIDLVDLKVGFFSDDDTYDYISDVSFLTSINFLLLGNTKFFLDNPNYVDVMQILVESAYSDRKEAFKEEKKKPLVPNNSLEKSLYELDKYYFTLSTYTQILLFEFQLHAFGKKTENPILKKVKHFFGNKNKSS